ncbi:hypothetical protein NBRC116588_01950 [Pyruvatibacter sp. HU-CL02332]
MNCDPVIFVWISLISMALFHSLARRQLEREIAELGLDSLDSRADVAGYGKLYQHLFRENRGTCFRAFMILHVMSGVSIFYASQISAYVCG